MANGLKIGRQGRAGLRNHLVVLRVEDLLQIRRPCGIQPVEELLSQNEVGRGMRRLERHELPQEGLRLIRLSQSEKLLCLLPQKLGVGLVRRWTRADRGDLPLDDHRVAVTSLPVPFRLFAPQGRRLAADARKALSQKEFGGGRVRVAGKAPVEELLRCQSQGSDAIGEAGMRVGMVGEGLGGPLAPATRIVGRRRFPQKSDELAHDVFRNVRIGRGTLPELRPELLLAPQFQAGDLPQGVRRHRSADAFGRRLVCHIFVRARQDEDVRLDQRPIPVDHTDDERPQTTSRLRGGRFAELVDQAAPCSVKSINPHAESAVSRREMAHFVRQDSQRFVRS